VINIVTLTADVTDGIKKMTQELIKTGMYKSQSEIVRDAIRQLAYKYNIGTVPPIDEVRKTFSKAGKKTRKTLAQTVREIRDD